MRVSWDYRIRYSNNLRNHDVSIFERDNALRISYVSEMLSLEEIKAVIAARGLTQGQVAARLGIGQSAVSLLLAGKRRISLEEARSLEEWLQPASSVQPAPMPTVPPSQWPRDVPVVGGGLAAPLHVTLDGADLDIEQTALDYGADPDFAPRPPNFAANKSLYCVYVWGDSMVPRFDAGDRLYVDPRRPPAVGDDVVVQLRGEGDDEQTVVALIKKLARRNGSTVELEQYNPAARIVIEKARVAAIHRIVPWRELL